MGTSLFARENCNAPTTAEVQVLLVLAPSKLALLMPGLNSAVQKYKSVPAYLIPKDAETADPS